jgi:hypothetical protein
MFWECGAFSACEAMPNGFDPKGLGSSYWAMKRPKDITSPARFWEDVVRLYSLASLIEASDKLVAIAGVAKFVRGLSNDDYLAGLCR